MLFLEHKNRRVESRLFLAMETLSNRVVPEGGAEEDGWGTRGRTHSNPLTGEVPIVIVPQL